MVPYLTVNRKYASGSTRVQLAREGGVRKKEYTQITLLAFVDVTFSFV